jgi:membrane protein DedA with SNARE-associated domain
MQSFVQSYGYFALILLSIAESACAPIPSEVTFGFAGAFSTVAVGGAGHFQLWLVILIGTLGSLVGSIIAYEVGRTAGRTIVDRWGKWILLTHKDLDASERWFAKYGTISVLIGRILPDLGARGYCRNEARTLHDPHIDWIRGLGNATFESRLRRRQQLAPSQRGLP